MRELNIMTWNVRYFGHGLKGLRAYDGWMRKLASAIAALPSLPDVIALQEVETRSLRAGLGEDNQLDRFLEFLHEALAARGHDRAFESLYFPAHRYALKSGPALYTTGLAVLVAAPLHIDAHNADQPHPITFIKDNALARFKQTRIAAHVRLKGPERSLDFFNTHLSLPAFTQVGPHRVHSQMGHGRNQLAEVESLLGFMESNRTGENAVLVGDFNAAPGSPVYDALVGGGLVDAHATFSGRSPARLGQIATARFMHLRMHVDHVFATPSVHWKGFTAHRIDRGAFAGLSDHAPKVGRMELGRR